MANQHFRTGREQSLYRALEQKLLATFQAGGYQEVDTPILEVSRDDRDGVYAVLGQNNQLLSLRLDFTQAIAAWAAASPLPEQRCAYFGQVFRRGEGSAGGLQVLLQAGVELLGLSAPEADLEVIALAIDSLRAAGVAEPYLVLGHADFLRIALKERKLNPLLQRQLLRALARHDHVTFRQLAKGCPEPALLLALPELTGEVSLLKTAAQLAPSSALQAALAELQTTVESLQRLGYGPDLRLNLGLYPELEYYSGLLFEGYARGAGEPLLSGGRYDALLRSLGADLPATGFAVSVDGLLQLMAGEVRR